MPTKFICFVLYLPLRGISVFKTMKAKNLYYNVIASRLRRSNLNIIIAIFLLGLFSCEERVNINTQASPPRLVIYGCITTDTTQQAISITRSTGYFITTKPEGISNAKVSIGCEGEVFELNESPAEPGVYLTSPDVYGIPGKTYTLHASLDFNGDGNPEEYEAVSYLPFPATLDSAAVVPMSALNDHLQVIVWGNLPEESSGYYSFHLFRNGKALNDSLRGFQIVRDDYINTKKITALPVFLLDPKDSENENILPGDTVRVQVESITSEYATFIENARTELRGPIPLFGGPPANVKTNIQCLSAGSKTGVSGFFTAYSKRKTEFVK